MSRREMPMKNGVRFEFKPCLYCELVVDHPGPYRFPPLTSDSGPRWRY